MAAQRRARGLAARCRQACASYPWAPHVFLLLGRSEKMRVSLGKGRKKDPQESFLEIKSLQLAWA
jgi:hypothetical protein